ncbi:TraR/DksA C4-type zinc finger protein [Enterobacter hormaechei]
MQFKPLSHLEMHDMANLLITDKPRVRSSHGHHRHRIDRNAVSAERCEECDELIPEPRRAAVPGCQTCASCQGVIELRNKQRGM